MTTTSRRTPRNQENWNPANRQLAWRIVFIAMIYVATVLISSWIVATDDPSRPWTVLLALLPAGPVLAMIWAVSRYLQVETDDFLRSLFIRTLLWALACTVSAASVWGLLQAFALVPAIPLLFIVPALALFFGLCTPFVGWRYRSAAGD